MKKIISIGVLVLVFGCICLQFWYSEWQYSLPTPIPSAYHVVNAREHISMANKFSYPKDKPVFLHFFNPDCPCSRFNMPHFKSLADMYADKISFAVVVMTANADHTEKSIRKKYSLDMPVLFDTTLATTCGVYSTPQAVLLNTDQALYYRGNYNKTRYCTDKKSNYAQMAIDSLLARRAEPVFSQYALTAYGCSLPKCKLTNR